jgi:hypothetical protein
VDRGHVVSLLYRAVWNDDRPDLFDATAVSFRAWLRSKQIDLEPNEEAPSADGLVEVTERRKCEGGVEALRLQLHEERPDSGERWSTIVTALRAKDGEQFLWVDLERVAVDFSQRPDLNAPGIVRLLIESGSDPRVDQVRLSTRPTAVAARPLAGLIRNPNRSLPLIVFSHDPAFPPDVTLGRACETLRQLLGATQVCLLGTEECAELRDILGDELAVWSGSARLYLPNRDASGLRPERHRFVLPTRFGVDCAQPARIFGHMLGGVVTARRAPACYAVVRRGLRERSAHSDADLLPIAEEEIQRIQRAFDELKLELAGMESDLFDTQADLEEAISEVTSLRDGLAWTRFDRKVTDGLTRTDLDRLADTPTSIAEAITWAAERLSGVVVHVDAPHDIRDLDSAVNGPSWAELSWRGLRALHLYALAGHEGDFFAWCSSSKHPWIWPASKKKLAMRESETVTTCGRYRAQRLLPIDRTADASGRIHMWAHLKIAEGGGQLAPRVYFHDDTRGATGKVHVGFIGPHRYMENTRTN